MLKKATKQITNIVLSLFLLAPCFGSATDIKIVTEEFPPYDFSGENGRVEGLATDVVRAVLNELGLEIQIEILPWARAFKWVSETPNTMLYSVVRTEEREPLFHWVGVVCEVRSYLYKLKSRTDISANALSELKDYRIGVVRGWAGQKYLQKNEFTRLEEVAESNQNMLKLMHGRVDLIEDYEANLIFRMKTLGLDANLVEKVLFNADISGELYAVINVGTDLDVARRFKDAFQLVHQDGRYAAIQEKWLRFD